MPLDELHHRVTQADAFMKQAVALFPGLYAMTDEERKTTTGRLRTGEGPIFREIVGIIHVALHLVDQLARCFVPILSAPPCQPQTEEIDVGDL